MKYLCLGNLEHMYNIYIYIYIYFVHTYVYIYISAASAKSDQGNKMGPRRTSWEGQLFTKMTHMRGLMYGYFQKWWFIMETPIKMDDLGVPLFSETPVLMSFLESPPHLVLTCLLSNTIPILRLLFIFPNKCQLLSVAIQLLISRHGCQYWLCLIWWYTLKVSRWKL